MIIVPVHGTHGFTIYQESLQSNYANSQTWQVELENELIPFIYITHVGDDIDNDHNYLALVPP